MPMYTIRNKSTDVLKEVFLPYSALQELIAEGEYEQVHLSAPSLVTHTGNVINKTSGDWKDHLKKVKKAAGTHVKNTVNI
jgi:hypothetical protein